MDNENQTAITRLLAEAGAAHGDYEATVLRGVHDEVWPDWYAAHLLEGGLADLLPSTAELGRARLGSILTRLDADFRRLHPASEWPAYYAAHLASMVDDR